MRLKSRVRLRSHEILVKKNMKNDKTKKHSVQGHKDIYLVTWVGVLLFVLLLFLFAYVSSITGKVTGKPSNADVRLGYLQTLSTCSHNRDCPPDFYCQAYDAQGTQITSETPYVEFGLCLPLVKTTVS